MMSLCASGISKGDEVITAPISFIASASSIIHVGAKPVFVDVKEDLNIDPDKIESAITKKTKAIMPVHWTGRMCEMEKIKKIANGMNSHIRLSMYKPGQFFGIHKDGINFDKNDNKRMSYATLNIFLNDDFEGGNTTFYRKDKKTVKFVCKPKEGSGSFFYSQQFHEGNKILNGYKYLLRTDLMISNNKK